MASSSRSKQSSSKMNYLLPPPPPLNPNSTVSDKGKTLIPPPENTNPSQLTREQVLRRRSDNLKELANCYKDNLWTLMEDVRVQFSDFTWKFGETPFEEDKCKDNKESEENVGDGIVSCAFHACKSKAMALTRFCHLHILSDSKQQLYKPCSYVIRSSAAGDTTCGKPILRATVPAHCNTHKQKAQYHLNRALRKAGLNINPSDTVAPPKLNVLVAEFVREIQTKRKAVVKAKQKAIVNK